MSEGLESINSNLTQPHLFIKKVAFIIFERHVITIVSSSLHKTLIKTSECVQSKLWIDH